MLAANHDVATYSTDPRVRLQAPNMEMGRRPSLGLLEVSVGERQLVPQPLQVLM